jgi:hypothetical protein
MLGWVIGESGENFAVKLAPSRRIVVITGQGSKTERKEWRFTFEQVRQSHESLLFEKVYDLLICKGLAA